jgi:hypothetical protein
MEMCVGGLCIQGIGDGKLMGINIVLGWTWEGFV